MYVLTHVLLLTVLLAPEVPPQVPSVPQQTPAAREEVSDDPLGRSTPHGTVLGFLRAASREEYDQAANYLDTQQRGDLARELAQQLQTILDRETSIDLNKLSRRPEGSLANPQNPNRDLVGVVSTSSAKVEIWLERVQRGDNPPIWLFSKETLRLVPEVYQDIGNVWGMERYLPDWLKTKIFSLPLWRWCILLAVVPLILLLGSLLARLLKVLIPILTGRMLGDNNIAHVQGLLAPLRPILFGVLFLVNASYSYTVRSRHFWHNLGNVLIVFGVTWLLMKIIGIATNLAVARLKRLRSSDKIALASLLGRLSQIGVLIAGGLIVLYLDGANLTAALTGLGIGGIALAFAAQKTLENLFGGIMIISDRPLRIGDFCNIGAVTGNVLDIGLRSTRILTLERTIMTIPNGQVATMNLENYTLRDKFWFHPTITLRHETTVDQMYVVLREIREMLAKYVSVESKTARVRFISIGKVSLDVEIFAYVLAADYSEFLAIQEDLLSKILEIVQSSGVALALPIQVVHESDSNARWPKT